MRCRQDRRRRPGCANKPADLNCAEVGHLRASCLVIHHTASPIAANARSRSHAFTAGSRPVASLIAVTDQVSALASTAGSPRCSRFQTARQFLQFASRRQCGCLVPETLRHRANRCQ
jgi:hypothetical protein